MRMTYALAAILASTMAVPALAGDWRYHGGPKAPDSLSGPWYGEYAAGYGYNGYVPYAYNAYGAPYPGAPWAGPPYRYRPWAYRW